MKLHFYGADRCVTGSCHCLEINGKKILVDCGLQQGAMSWTTATSPLPPAASTFCSSPTRTSTIRAVSRCW